ncbi:type 2 isopentenyl-diphosphate Delta-isomerase [Lactococcus termiticola]|uniref:Isopentenyl-diphosphate delta-isomerase n=1 Tax=Lactococcus termiticola TaxID=2169526 RepID=A0A2R5HEG1_9LACT|nr:type 2 isopentenyl-diphosphate Delta-isomerase [Lactococcus termiticola]GBG96467.1 isopentenyl pyrophosphate isomerase [Lactococcus termiticola]
MSTDKAIHQHRKDEHLSLALKQWKTGPESFSGLSFDDLRLLPRFSELAETDIDLSVSVFGNRFEFPFYIEAMTGGSERGDRLNEELAEVASQENLSMAVGSQSIALKFPELEAGFRRVRQIHKDGFILANIGAGHDLESAKKAVDMLEANALEIHVNTAQELSMKQGEGDRAFYWLDNIQKIAEGLEVPVIVKEVGFGMSPEMLERLSETAIDGINLGGKSGTNFARIEHDRGGDFSLQDFGLTTVESLLSAKQVKADKALVATGGIQSAEQIFKSLGSGANLVSSAGYFLKVLMTEGQEALAKTIQAWKADLTKFYLLQGAKNWEELQSQKFLYSPSAKAFIDQIKGFD